MSESHLGAEVIQLEIEAAEASIVRATNAKDSAALSELLSPDIMINSPANKVIDRNEMIAMTVKGEMTYSSYENITEAFSLYGPDVAVLMGRETFIHADGEFGDKEVTRRYTDVWQRSGGFRLPVKLPTHQETFKKVRAAANYDYGSKVASRGIYSGRLSVLRLR